MAEVTMASEALVIKGKDEELNRALRQAAWQLEDAMDEKVCQRYPPELEARDLFFEVRHAEKHYYRALIAMVLLTIYETPTWCDTANTWDFIDPHDRCRIYGEPTPAFPQGKPIEVMLSGITYLPPGFSLIFEVALLGILFRKLWLERELQDKFFTPLLDKGEEYVGMRKVYFCMAMIAIEAADCLVFGMFRPKLRIAFLCRTALFCMMPSVIKLYECISKIMVEVATVAVFFVGFLFFFAWVSVMIFNGFPNPPQHFSGFKKAFYGLFVAGVCDEFTDILIESYTAYRWIGILWFIFLVVVHLLFLSLVLDTLCAGYMNSEKTESLEITKEKAEGILRAFKTLNKASCSEKHMVSRETFMLFLEEFVKSPNCSGASKVEQEYALIAFQFVDEDGDGFIDENQFANIATLTQYTMWNTKTQSCLREWAPGFWNNPSVGTISEFFDITNPDGMFSHLMNMVLGVNFILVLVETTYDLNKWDEPAWTAYLEFTFSFVYLGECMFKIGVSGWDFYGSEMSNKFDFCTTMLLLSTSVFESLLGSLSTYANILRLFRLLRVVKQLKRLDKVQFMVSTVVKLVSKSQEMLTLLSVVVFGFTVVSVQLFGGLLYEENPALHEILDENGAVLFEKTDYAEKGEFVLNFNDWLMAFGLWFVHLLCEYKPSFAQAINRASPFPGAWLICGLFWAIAVCITFELVKAFTIEVYMDLKKKWDLKAKGGEVYPAVITEIHKEIEKRGQRFWWKCLVVDEDEYDEVKEKVEELLEEEEIEEKEEERRALEAEKGE